MVKSFRNPGPTTAQLVTALLSDSMPMEEGTAGAAGAQAKASRGDHSHKRLTSTATGNLDGSAQATIMFTRTFSKKPAVTALAVEDNANPVPRFKVRRWLKADGQPWTAGEPYGGCVIYGDRARALPTLSGILLIGPLITALAGFLPYEAAAGAEYSIIALEASQ